MKKKPGRKTKPKPPTRCDKAIKLVKQMIAASLYDVDNIDQIDVDLKNALTALESYRANGNS